ncbi:MAG: ABC transporter ATP-binding protein, partial [Solirubrobacteraceae bacterium]
MSVDAPSVNPDGGGGPEEPPAPSAQPLLYATGVSKEFGGLIAVNDVSFDITPGTIVSIIGPNGAGKTTFFNMLTGLYKPTRGRIYFDGRDITRARPDKITGAGVARTFQNIRLFGAMSALENVMVGRHPRMKTGLLGAIGRPPWVRREERDVRKSAADMLSYVGLESSHFDNLAINLSYGDQRRVEIARALASNPKLLL